MVIAATGQRLLHPYGEGVIIVGDIAAINDRIGAVIIVIRITIPVAVTIKGRTDPTIIAMMPMMPAAVMIVIAMITAAITQATAIPRPPKTIQRMLSRRDMKDMMGFLAPSEPLGRGYQPI